MNPIEVAAIVVFLISFYGLITGKKMIKAVVYMVLMQSAVIVFFLSIGFQSGTVPPMGAYLEYAEHIADPLPQALMITAIVVGVAVTTINITMLMAFFRKHPTTDWDEARKKSMEKEGAATLPNLESQS
ncbi:MAG: cation:proton antiporter subunit C [Oscillospiraceae bacterium]|nr:cation:proton antiporter subunit C [Oscillospiraceae bacterium]